MYKNNSLYGIYFIYLSSVVIFTETSSTQCYITVLALQVGHGSSAPGFPAVPTSAVLIILNPHEGMGVHISLVCLTRNRTWDRTGGGIWSGCRVKGRPWAGKCRRWRSRPTPRTRVTFPEGRWKSSYIRSSQKSSCVMSPARNLWMAWAFTMAMSIRL